MDDKFIQAKECFEQNDLDHAIDMLSNILIKDSSHIDAFLLRGLVYYRMQKWGEAINDFSSVIELSPNHSEAKLRLEMTENILGYFTPDMFNP